MYLVNKSCKKITLRVLLLIYFSTMCDPIKSQLPVIKIIFIEISIEALIFSIL